MLELWGLEAAYGRSQVLFGVDLHVGTGEVVTLLGRNGMGKTTTVNTIKTSAMGSVTKILRLPPEIMSDWA